MNKAFKLLIASFISISALAQNSDSSKWKHFYNLFDNPYKTQFDSIKIVDQSASVFMHTNRISNRFIYPFVLGGSLDKSVIDKNLANDKNKRFHQQLNFDVRFINLDSKRAWYITTGYHQRLSLNVSNDAMKLIFRGNTQKDIYQFNHAYYNQIRFNKLGAGLYFAPQKIAKPYNLRIGIYGIQGLNHGKISAYEQNYLQGNDDSLTVGLNYNASFANQSFGAGAELIFNQSLSANQAWGFRFENFGYVYSNQNSSTYHANGTFVFNGLVISDLSKIRTPNYFETAFDSLTNPMTNKEANQSQHIWIAPISFLYYTLKHQRMYYQFGLHHSGNKAVPSAEIRAYRFMKSKVLLGLTLGGIGQLYVNTDMRWAINRRWFLQAGLYHLEALVWSTKLGGMGANFGLQAAF